MEFNFYVNAIPRSNIRFQSDLAGGSLMDLGCYGINLFRYLCHEEPKVLSANAICQNPEIDDEMMAELQFPNHNISGTIKCSLIADHFDQRLKIIGTKGEMEISRPVNPILFQKIVIKKGNSKNKIGVFGNLTWIYQMRAFVNALKTKEPMLSSIEDGILNMQVIDTIYRKAGLQQRESSNTI
jgi:predicted dehydrogenase